MLVKKLFATAALVASVGAATLREYSPSMERHVENGEVGYYAVNIEQ